MLSSLSSSSSLSSAVEDSHLAAQRAYKFQSPRPLFAVNIWLFVFHTHYTVRSAFRLHIQCFINLVTQMGDKCVIACTIALMHNSSHKIVLSDFSIAGWPPLDNQSPNPQPDTPHISMTQCTRSEGNSLPTKLHGLQMIKFLFFMLHWLLSILTNTTHTPQDFHRALHVITPQNQTSGLLLLSIELMQLCKRIHRTLETPEKTQYYCFTSWNIQL